MNILYNNAFCNSSFAGYNQQFSQEQEREIFATFFEQLLLFDHIVISTDRDNFSLAFLISRLGVDTVERLVRSGYIKFSIKSTVIFTGVGRTGEDGKIDESAIYSQPPIVGAVLADNELDSERNVFSALQHFEIEKKVKKRLLKNISDSYITTDSMKIGVDTAEFVLDSYRHNLLSKLGLPYNKEPNDLNLDERGLLVNFANSILEAGVISKNGFKSYNYYGELEIAEQTFENIGKAYNIGASITEILRIENTPDLKQVYLNNSFTIDDIFKIRHLKTAKYFRKWINDVGENANVNEVTEAYLAEIKGAKKIFSTTKGKIVKTTLLYGATSGLGALIGGVVGAIAGGAAVKPLIEPVVDYGLGLIEEFTVDSIFAGKNPKIFVDELKEEIKRINA
jgi:hypothetical protein